MTKEVCVVVGVVPGIRLAIARKFACEGFEITGWRLWRRTQRSYVERGVSPTLHPICVRYYLLLVFLTRPQTSPANISPNPRRAHYLVFTEQINLNSDQAISRLWPKFELDPDYEKLLV